MPTNQRERETETDDRIWNSRHNITRTRCRSASPIFCDARSLKLQDAAAADWRRTTQRGDLGPFAVATPTGTAGAPPNTRDAVPSRRLPDSASGGSLTARSRRRHYPRLPRCPGVTRGRRPGRRRGPSGWRITLSTRWRLRRRTRRACSGCPSRGGASTRSQRRAGYRASSPLATPALSGAASQIVDPPIVLWLEATLRASHASARRHRRFAEREPDRAEVARRARAWGTTWRRGLCRGERTGPGHRRCRPPGRTRRRRRSRSPCSACGVDIIYPAGARGLADDDLERGALVSEFPPGHLRPAAPLSAAQPHHQRACPGRWWSSRPPTGAGRSSPPGRRSSRAGTCSPCPGNVRFGLLSRQPRLHKGWGAAGRDSGRHPRRSSAGARCRNGRRAPGKAMKSN